MIQVQIINRGSVTIIPKKPFYDWGNNIFQDDTSGMSVETTFEYNSYLLKEDDVFATPDKKLKKYWKYIFENELFGICTDDGEWPPKLTWKLFTEWFDFRFSSMVFDLDKGIIEKSEF